MTLPPSLLPIARRLHAVLLLEIEHEIEIERMVSDERYARDVLLVCDACPQTVLPQLATRFRALSAPPEAAAAAVAAAPAPVVDLPDSMARRAMAVAWAADATNPPPSPPGALHPLARLKTRAAAQLRRWWTHLGKR